jgi:hypothetical protein
MLIDKVCRFEHYCESKHNWKYNIIIYFLCILLVTACPIWDLLFRRLWK